MKYLVTQEILVDAEDPVRAVLKVKSLVGLGADGVIKGFQKYTVWTEIGCYQATVDMDKNPPEVIVG